MLSSLPATLRERWPLLLELQSRCLAQDDELDLLRHRLQTLEDTVQIQRDLYQRQGLYWLRSQGVSLGPFCPQCQENGGRAHPLVPHGHGPVLPLLSRPVPPPRLSGDARQFRGVAARPHSALPGAETPVLPLSKDVFPPLRAQVGGTVSSLRRTALTAMLQTGTPMA